MTQYNLRSSPGFRLVIIGFLTACLLIPTFMIQFMIYEREQRRNTAVQEVSGKWGALQTVAGPVLTIPYRTYQREKTGNTERIITIIQYAHFLPDELTIDSEIMPEIRYRGIYEVVLYNTRLLLTGRFSAPNPRDLSIQEADMVWEDAVLSIGISDMKGIKDTIQIAWNDSTLTADPGAGISEVLNSGVNVPAILRPEAKAYSFALAINLNGSEELNFVPVAKETRVHAKAPWGTPSFIGEFLPESREIESNRFTASWKVLNLNRNFPQQWAGNSFDIYPSQFGVRLLFPVDGYQQTTRTVKYAIMFIGLTFLAFFMMEILNRKVLHPIQYLLVGSALVIFYTLLLSISEHISFAWAYLIASGGIVMMITGYTKNALADFRLTAIIAGMLILVYGFMFVILQQEDFALLLGSVGLFATLALVMYLTRRIDWFTIWQPDRNE